MSVTPPKQPLRFALAVMLALGACVSGPMPSARAQPPAADEAPGVDPSDANGESARTADETTSANDDASSATPQAGPRIVMVAIGQSDAILQSRAERLAAGLVSHAGLRIPSDAALRAALLGAAGTDGDGLAPARAARRSLGWERTRDLETLTQIATQATASAVVTLRATPDGMQLEVFDAVAGAYFEGTLLVPHDGPLLPAARFIRARARRAGAQVAGSQTPHQRDDDAQSASGPDLGPEAAAATTAAPGNTPEGATAPDEEPRVRRFFRKNWPYLLLGVVVVGVATGAIVARRRGDEDPQMFFRFQPAP